MSILYTTLVGASLLSVATAQTLALQFTNSPPSGASQAINPSFAGFGIEPSNLFSFTGGSDSNALTFQLLNNLAGYTGAPPHIRLGGNTQDYMIYEDSQDAYAWTLNPKAVGQGNFPTDHMVIGPRFFEVANRLPENTPVTWGLNLAYTESDYISQIVLMANQVFNRTPRLNIVSMEIGNEPDLYLGNGFRTGTWGGRLYTQQWLDRAAAVYEQVLKPRGIQSNFFEPGATASTIGTDFQIDQLDGFGITEQANDSSASYVASWNQHDYYYYIGVSTYPLTLYSFMTLSTTSDQFSAWVSQIQQADATPYPYALREMGVVGPIGMNGITDTFGAALWTLNFFLYAASLNISSVQMHMTDNSNASAWQPIEYYGQGPHVRPNYYGFAAFDQIIGPTCQAQVAAYDINAYPEGYGGRVVAYSVYQAGSLATIVVINSNMANVSETDKASIQVQLSLPASLAGQTLHLAYLTNTGADATSGTTWNGISYERNSDGSPTTVDNTDQTVQVGSDGSVSFSVRDSQAVVANVGARVGTGRQANQSACAALAAQSPSTRSAAASSATSSSAGTSNRGSSSTASAARASSTSGVVRLTSMVFSTIGMALLSGALLIWT